MSRDLNDLTPETREKCLRLIQECEERGIFIMIIETLRTRITQEAYYAQGREPLTIVNMMRRKAGLWAISAEENERKITWTLKSKHFDGTAFDIALVINGRPTWNLKIDMNANEERDYDEVGRIGESIGLTWGGRFKNPDKVHFQKEAA